MGMDMKEDARERTSDLAVVRWLVGFVKPYRTFMLLALFLMTAAAALELAIPYLTKLAVDRFIYPSWRIATFGSRNRTLKEHVERRYPGVLVMIGEDEFLIDIGRVGRTDRTNLEKQGVVSEEPYIVVDPARYEGNSREQVKKILEEEGSPFRKAGGLYYAASSSLTSLRPGDIKTLRAQDLSNVGLLACGTVLALVGVFITTSLFTYLLQYSGQKIMNDIRTGVFSHLLLLPQKFFDHNPIGRLTTRVTNDVNAINEMYTSVLVQFIKDVMIILGVLAVMFYMNRSLTLIILTLTVILGVIGTVFRVRLRRAYRNVRRSIGRLNAFVQESVRGMLLLKLHMKEKENHERFLVLSKENFDANMEQVLAFSTFRPIIELISILAIASILWYGGRSVLSLELTIGALLAYLFYIRMLFAPILELAERFNILQSAIAASENLYELCQVEEEKNTDLPVDPIFHGRLEFKNVWFSYNGSNWVLKDVSFSVSPGETVAIVGLTGSGKTTIANLILKFYEAQRGEILWDGIPIERLNPIFLRSHISCVFQDAFLFSKHIGDGTADGMGRHLSLPFGISRHNQDGGSLSAGEKQIASIAQALSKDFKFLIMDEATSQVDAERERAIQKLLLSNRENKAILIIAHRLSNVKNADRIIVMHRGEICETGSHAELIEKRGIYHSLYKLQTHMHSYSSYQD
jgi:ATP-binding cassette subfamily B protein/subfamily B ATP-binding cassette protein MsbA